MRKLEAWIWYYENIGKKRCPIVDTWWQTETSHILITTLPGIDVSVVPEPTVEQLSDIAIQSAVNYERIAAKIVQKLSNHRMFGPILQGTSKPVAYVPRGSSTEDIVDQVRLLIA